MKPLIAASLIAVAATAASGCAPLDMSVFVEGASFLDESCSSAGDVQLLRGGLDLGPSAAAGVLPVYFGHFGLRSDLEPTTIKSGDDILAGETRNEFVADQVRISYALQSGPTVAEALEPIFFVVSPGSTDGFIQFQMLSTAAGTMLANSVPNGGDDTLKITFNFEGNVRGSTNALTKMKTPVVVFPVRVVNNTPVFPACTAPAVPTLAGPCGNSQESFSFTCK
ncbi:MAG TPA: hypothetical protein VFA20_14840 [Myxococcaceae bacterium]|nr:hypothetical protein [Myxococcaceae bacterium]